jgi:hypothetical protein
MNRFDTYYYDLPPTSLPPTVVAFGGIVLLMALFWVIQRRYRKFRAELERRSASTPNTPDEWLEYADWHKRLAAEDAEFRGLHLQEVEYGENVAQSMLEKQVRESRNPAR